MARKDTNDKDDNLVLLTHTLYTRISHWLVVIFLGSTVITSFYLSNPTLIALPFRVIRQLHLLLNGILSALILMRLYYAIVTGDIRNFGIRRGDGKKLVQLLAYYFFLRKTPPYEGTKYNVGQRLIYTSWFYAWIFQAITGLILASPARPESIFFAKLMGGIALIRFYKSIVNVYFAATILIHIYLVLTSDPAKLQAMFTGYVRVKDGKTEQ